MTEFRRDPLVHRWVITGFGPNQNPEELVKRFQKGTDQKECGFCEGKEFLTPPETFAIRKPGSLPNSPGWVIRVIPNRATDLRAGELQKRGQGGIYDLQNASGIHETIVETPEHVNHFSHLSVPQIVNSFKTLHLRNAEHKKNHLLKGTLIFRNEGKEGGGLFEHSHSQIISLPFVPKTILDELEGARKYYELKTRCIFCDMIEEERRIAQRIVFETANYFAWCPFSSRFPFEVWVAGKRHQPEFLDADPNTFQDLAQLMKTITGSIGKVLGNIATSFVLHTAPYHWGVTDDVCYFEEAYHWHIEILPQAWTVGGFEWGGDFFLSPPNPEDSAKAIVNAL